MSVTITEIGTNKLLAWDRRRIVGEWAWTELPAAAVLTSWKAENDVVQTALAAYAATCFQRAGFHFVQLTTPIHAEEPKPLFQHGFRTLTNLEELSCEISEESAGAEQKSESPSSIVPIELLNLHELVRLWQATLQGTLDCPELNGCLGPLGLPAGYLDPRFEPNYCCYVARKAGQNQGLLIGVFNATAAVATIHYLGVTPEFRRFGVASGLLSHFFNVARLSKIHRIYTSVDQRNFPAKMFYQGKGFGLCGLYRVSVWLNPRVS